jgi:hypothetical protein
MSEKFPSDQENISPEEWLRRTRKVLEKISIESEEQAIKEEREDV